MMNCSRKTFDAYASRTVANPEGSGPGVAGGLRAARLDASFLKADVKIAEPTAFVNNCVAIAAMTTPVRAARVSRFHTAKASVSITTPAISLDASDISMKSPHIYILLAARTSFPLTRRQKALFSLGSDSRDARLGCIRKILLVRVLWAACSEAQELLKLELGVV